MTASLHGALLHRLGELADGLLPADQHIDQRVDVLQLHVSRHHAVHAQNTIPLVESSGE